VSSEESYQLEALIVKSVIIASSLFVPPVLVKLVVSEIGASVVKNSMISNAVSEAELITSTLSLTDWDSDMKLSALIFILNSQPVFNKLLDASLLKIVIWSVEGEGSS
jgi:hypothetical protein